MPVYKALASTVDAYKRCIERNNTEWEARHESKIEEIVKGCMPSGSGIDCGTKIDLNASTGEKLVFDISYHHMNDGGMYDGWTEHRVIVTPSLVSDFDLRITGPNRNDIKEYLHECYQTALSEVLEATPAQTALAS